MKKNTHQHGCLKFLQKLIQNTFQEIIKILVKKLINLTQVNNICLTIFDYSIFIYF